jgi:hypothetical protein
MHWYPVIVRDGAIERKRITEASFNRAIRLGQKLVDENLADFVRIEDESGNRMASISAE